MTAQALLATDSRAMTLGARTFEVPRLPLGVTIRAYPLLCGLYNSLFVERLDPILGGPSEDEMRQAADVVFLCAQVADPDLTREAFDALTATPQELASGVKIANFQTGAWRPVQPGDEPGELHGEPEPPTSTSAASSESSSAISISRRIIGWLRRRFRTGTRSTPPS